jgi:hypothetical protein
MKVIHVSYEAEKSEEEAISLFLHHIDLALAFYEAGPSKLGPWRMALYEAMAKDDARRTAVEQLLIQLDDVYNAMED